MPGRAGPAIVAMLTAVWLTGQPRVLALHSEEGPHSYAHTAWRVRDGAFRDSVAAIAQTPDGYLWLGTQFGLLRSDGVRHTLWEPPDGQALPSMNVRRLFVARDGRLWIGTQLGLASWNGRLTHHREIRGQVGGMVEDRTGTVWAGTRYPPPGTLCAFRRDGVQCFGDKNEFGARASSVYEDRSGALWVGAATGLWRWAPGGPRLVALADLESSRGLAESDDGALLVAERNGLRQLVGDRLVDYPLTRCVGDCQPSHLLRDRHGGLWIGTFDRGLLHLKRGRVEQFSQADGLSGNYIRDLFEDREGNIWVATDNGLDRFRHTAVMTMSVKQGLSHGTPWSVLAASDGSVWVGTLDGLNRLEGERTTIYRRQRSTVQRPAAFGARGAIGPARQPTGPSSAVIEIIDEGLPDNVIQSLFEDEQKRIWVSTRRGIASFENGRFHRLPGTPGNVHAMSGDANGGLWISEDANLLRLVDGRVDTRTPWTTLGRAVPAMPIVSDPVRGGVWLAFRDGSGLAHVDAGRITAAYSTAEGLGRGMVADLHLDADGALWAATEGGLSRIKDGRVHTLTSKDGLPCDGVHWAIEDDHRTWWLYTACGLARIARPQLDAWAAAVDSGATPAQRIQAAIYDSSDGVRIHAAPGGYTPHVGKSPDGRIWFLPWDGVSIIDPRRLPFNHLPPPVQIERVTVDDRSYAPGPGLELPPLTRDITIEFTALSLIAPEKTQFRYRLEGQDPQWRESLNTRQVQYSNLAPGPYRFRVLATNNSGVWNETGATLEFTILPAAWQTTWFRVLVAAVALSALGVAYRHRIRQLHRERRQLQDVVDRIPAIAGIARPDGSSEYLNRRWVEYTGVSAADAAGPGWRVAVHPQDQDRYASTWAESLARGEPLEIEARLRSASGEYRWFLLRAVPVRDKRGSISNWHAVMTDIEDRKNAERDLESLSGRLIHAQEEERKRIGRELHDDINQSLGLLAIRLDQLRANPAMPPVVARGLDRLKEDTSEVATHVHRLSYQLHSSTLDYLGLVPALKGLVDDVASRHGIDVALVESLRSAVPPNLALCLFRIVQEGLTNIVRHSHARSAQVRISTTGEGAHLEIEDDGIGFDLAQLQQHAGLGFVSMRERLRGLHGRVRIDSAPGRGTRIVVDVPLPDAGATEAPPEAAALEAELRARSAPA